MPSERSKDDRFHENFDDTSKTAALEELLASKLAEFLDSSFPYTLGQLSGAAKEHLYKGPPPDDQGGTWIMEFLFYNILPIRAFCNLQGLINACVYIGEAVSKEEPKGSDPVKPDMKRHPLKGGYAITDYLTYDWYVCHYQL